MTQEELHDLLVADGFTWTIYYVTPASDVVGTWERQGASGGMLFINVQRKDDGTVRRFQYHNLQYGRKGPPMLEFETVGELWAHHVAVKLEGGLG